MKKQKILEKMFNIAKSISGANAKNWSRDKENKLWTMACENDVFMAEHYDDNGNLDGFYIEDDYFLTTEV